MFAGDEGNDVYGEELWLPEETLDALREYLVGIKGQLTTRVGGEIRSIHVGIRQKPDLYACVRPGLYYSGVPSPVKRPEAIDMVIFRENTEIIYAGIEYLEGTDEVHTHLAYMREQLLDGRGKIRFPDTVGIGIKPVFRESTERLARAAVNYAIERDLPSFALVHKGYIMEFTKGAFRMGGHQVSHRFRQVKLAKFFGNGGPGESPSHVRTWQCPAHLDNGLRGRYKTRRRTRFSPVTTTGDHSARNSACNAFRCHPLGGKTKWKFIQEDADSASREVKDHGDTDSFRVTGSQQ